MTAFDDATLIAHALGELSPAQAAEVARVAEADEELAAKLDAFGACVGKRAEPTVATPRSFPPPRPSRRRFFRQLAASVAGVAVLGGAAYAGYELLREHPLLEDNFRDEWLDTRLWDTYRGRKGIREEGGHLRLLNRGSLVTAATLPEAVEIELDWMWLDLTGDPLYPDNLHIGLRTSGRHETEHSFRLLDGVEVEFQPHRGVACVNPALAAADITRISPAGELKFAPGKWYHLRVTDDGKRVSVFASGPEIDRKYAKEPAVAVDVPGGHADRRVAFFNREYLAGANHESRIDNVVIRKLVAK